jgi:dienelactone hydrolase
MANKKDKLIARSRETVRFPAPNRLEADRVKPKGYRVVAVSLYTPEADWIDKTAANLQKAGNPKANRSLVVREAILRLQEEVAAKEPVRMLKDFSEHQARRTRNGA